MLFTYGLLKFISSPGGKRGAGERGIQMQECNLRRICRVKERERGRRTIRSESCGEGRRQNSRDDREKGVPAPESLPSRAEALFAPANPFFYHYLLITSEGRKEGAPFTASDRPPESRHRAVEGREARDKASADSGIPFRRHGCRFRG